jgi:hypothetical protein
VMPPFIDKLIGSGQPEEVAHTRNPSYSEGWDLKDHGSMPAWARPHLNKEAKHGGVCIPVNTSYLGDIGRRIEVWDWPRQKAGDLMWKIKHTALSSKLEAPNSNPGITKNNDNNNR